MICPNTWELGIAALKPVSCQFTSIPPVYLPDIQWLSRLQMEIKNLYDLPAIYLPSFISPHHIQSGSPLIFTLTYSPMFLFFIFLLSAFLLSKKSSPSIKTQFKCSCLLENVSCIYSSYLYSIRNSLSRH